MKKWYLVPAVAGILTIGTATIADAGAPSNSPAQTTTSDSDNGSSKAGLRGLLGLGGLAGLAGLKRRNDEPRRDHSGASSSRTP